MTRSDGLIESVFGPVGSADVMAVLHTAGLRLLPIMLVPRLNVPAFATGVVKREEYQ